MMGNERRGVLTAAITAILVVGIAAAVR